jgi:ribosome-associated protein
MPAISIHNRLLVPEAAMEFSFIASAGPGGQNVNKRATKCQLRVPLHVLLLSKPELDRFVHLAASLVTPSGDVLIASGEHRSQERNRDECVERLADLLRIALVPPKVRRATKPSKRAKQRRIDEKKHRGGIKRSRKLDD